MKNPKAFSSKSPSSKHGGARKNAGRKKGSVKGRTVVSKTIAMAPDSWAKLDRDRGELSRGRYIEQKILPTE